ncbi:MAG: alpha/beta hydrolase [Thermoplasmata archaeon]|nr:alpha/beta hydrolase [Thermoplasmata archaeon]
MDAKPASAPGAEAGIGDDPRIVYLHGYPLDHRIWEPSVARSEDPSRAWLLDLPGYGRSQGLPVPDTLRGFSDWVHRTLVERSSDPFVVVGHSFGGYVALELYRDHPDVVRGLLLADTRSEADSEEARAKRAATIDRLRKPGQGLDVDAAVRTLVAPPTWSAQGAVVDLLRMVVASVPVPTLIATLTAIADRPDLTPTLATVTVPTVVVWGEEDQLIPPAESRGMVARTPGAVGVGIPAAGHLPSLEAPGAFADATRELLRRVDGP